MIEQEAVLATLRFDWADTPGHVWKDSPYHVDGLHPEVDAAIAGSVRDASGSDGPSPIGLVLQGQKGIGKTHLLGMVRRQVHAARGYFFLDNLSTGDEFWENAADSLRFGLSQVDESGEMQLRSFLRRICEFGVVDPGAAKRILSGHGLRREDVDAFVAGLRALDRQVAVECSDTARALVLFGSEDDATNDIAEDYLSNSVESKAGEREKWGIRRSRSALTIVRDVTWLLAMTGPVVICVDQLDTLIAKSDQTTGQAGSGATTQVVAQVADGLMRLRELTRRTVTVLATLPNTWAQLRASATDSVPDRFRDVIALGRIVDGGLGRALVERRLGVAYRGMGFTPPHPTWPVAAAAFDRGWEEMTPRELLKRIGSHIEACLRAGNAHELTTFREDGPRPVQPVRRVAAVDRFAEIDRLFEQARAEANPAELFDHKSEDEVMPRLLAAAFAAWLTEVGDDEMAWNRLQVGAGHELHAWFSYTVDERSDLVEYWAFRAINAKHHITALHRFRKARTAAGLRQGAENRNLVIIRNVRWSNGTKTQAELDAFRAAGGREVEMSEKDGRTFWALDRLRADGVPNLHEWLVDRRHASGSEFLSEVLPAMQREDGPRPPDGEILLGSEAGEPIRVELAALRKHAVVFAGSGSGKTVLLRRIVEECALQGVSAIVLDPNNDLARLGDAWPSAPGAWGDGDAELARRYLADVDVRVWTPGRANGRPLAFRPLPDFAGVLADEDEFTAAVEVAVASLAPQVRLTGSTVKATKGLAVLRQAVVHHARTGSRSLPELIDVLADLPEGVSTLNDGRRIAGELAESLKAAMVNDPLFAGSGTGVDPGELVTPKEGKKARVSVISFIGLPAEEQRQNFVNQLQMELFAWAKRNPAGDRPLGALFVMDEAQTLAASGSLTASTRSTIVLASQGRKYGLGLLFATQAPKGLHNQVAGNAMTQFFGRLNSPAQIAAANELARAKGSRVADISRLERAEFYVSGEAFGFRRVTTPLCLTHHPASPLTQEEVIERARRE
ncbi:ATP-binding protein [Actinokineospora inagensis]|uniref:ATP-binding protein n=1 Tax=Actinokineospora inagensis TaxID=103730 RepID=UPI00040488D3|nr:ATP-binding protein [Actinokineospora inagensis]